MANADSIDDLPLDETEPIPADDLEIVPSNSGSELRDFEFVVTEEYSGKRVDLVIALLLDNYSRVFLRRIVMENKVCVNGTPVKPAFKVFTGQTIKVNLLPPPPKDGPIPENIPLDILFEDDCFVIINK